MPVGSLILLTAALVVRCTPKGDELGSELHPTLSRNEYISTSDIGHVKRNNLSKRTREKNQDESLLFKTGTESGPPSKSRANLNTNPETQTLDDSNTASESISNPNPVIEVSFANDGGSSEIRAKDAAMTATMSDVIRALFDRGSGRVGTRDCSHSGRAASKEGYFNCNRPVRKGEARLVFNEGGEDDLQDRPMEFEGLPEGDDEDDDDDDEDKKSDGWNGTGRFVPARNRHRLPSHESITGGRTISIQEMPFLAILRVFKEHGPTYCTASIVSDRWVLSAAHCIGRITDPRRVEVSL